MLSHLNRIYCMEKCKLQNSPLPQWSSHDGNITVWKILWWGVTHSHGATACQGFPEPAKVGSQPRTRRSVSVVAQNVPQHKAQKGKVMEQGEQWVLPGKESIKYSIKSNACICLWILCCKFVLIYQVSVLGKEGEKNPHYKCILCLHRGIKYFMYIRYEWHVFL